MHCPACHAEYRPGFDTCVDCGIPLEHGPAPAPPNVSHELTWAPLCAISSETEAQIIQGLLESAGIDCQIESLKFHAEPVNFGPLSNVRLHVRGDQLEAAQKLLAEYKSDCGS